MIRIQAKYPKLFHFLLDYILVVQKKIKLVFKGACRSTKRLWRNTNFNGS